MTTLFLIIVTIALIAFLYIHFSDSREITKEEYNNKRELLKQKDFNRIKRKINRQLNKRYTHFNIGSKYSHDKDLIIEYFQKITF